jgi:hypothetical protein
MKLTLTILALVATGCSNSHTPIGALPFAPSVVLRSDTAFAPQADRRLPPIVPVAGIGCPTGAPPALITAETLSATAGTIHLEWSENVQSDQVRITILRRDVTNTDLPYRTVREATSKGLSGIRIPAGDGIYTVTVQYEYNLRCGGLLSFGTTRVVGIGLAPAPIVIDQPCEAVAAFRFTGCED